MARIDDLEDELAALRREVEALKRRLPPEPRRITADEATAAALAKLERARPRTAPAKI